MIKNTNEQQEESLLADTTFIMLCIAALILGLISGFVYGFFF